MNEASMFLPYKSHENSEFSPSVVSRVSGATTRAIKVINSIMNNKFLDHQKIS